MHRDSTPPGVAVDALRHTVRLARGAVANAFAPRPPAIIVDVSQGRAPRPGKDDDDEVVTDLHPSSAPLGSGPRVHPPTGVIESGRVLGSYRVLEPLANGGMGAVYLGEHVHLGRKVALKFLHPRLLDDEWAVSRFFAEAVAAARISHPGAVSVFDVGSFEGGVYLVMEYLRGETLSARLAREGRLPVDRILDIGIQLALTLAAAHEAGVIHRDLKPDNVHLVPDSSGSGFEYVKVFDFGVAKLVRGRNCAPHTRRGDLLGTPFYMAPEQSMHAGTVDHRCDIYSLGCLLYQLITGETPFRGSLLTVLLAHQNETAPPPRSLAPSIPPALDALIVRMMTKSPAGRPGSMVEVMRALSNIQREYEPAPPRRPPTPARRAAWLGLLFGVGMVVAGLGRLAMLW
jgi:serine/threonine-protein kinase